MSNGLSAIKHVVVVMFENRSFDHIFGAIPGVDGVLTADGKVKPELYNLPSPTEPPTHAPDAKNLPVPSWPIDTTYLLPVNFNHDFGDGMMPDLFGPGTTGWVDGHPINAPKKTYPPTNSGFISTMLVGNIPPSATGPSAMTYFEMGALKVLHTLADEFVVCDNWFCDMPGHTLPNRCFMHCATTGDIGIGYNDFPPPGIKYISANTIFQLIESQGKTWKMYTPGGQLDSYWLNPYIQGSNSTGIPISTFAQEAADGTLPFYSFLMCWTGNAPTHDTSMHPRSPVQAGENYLAAIYNTLRASKSWDDTLLIVTFDENGGIYDHVVPPAGVKPDKNAKPVFAPPPDGTTYEFDFTLLGLRVPALLISPWLAKNGIDSTQYQNTSILRFIEDLLVGPTGLPRPSLTDRDRQATSIAHVFDRFGLATPRTDCPRTIAGYPGYAWANGRLDDGPGLLSKEEAALPPMPHMVEIAQMYANGQPGHPDSGKPITREFATVAELDDYVRERAEAARRYFANRR
jgi:phospholipase C